MTVGECHHRADDCEEHDQTDDESNECGARVSAVRGVRRVWMLMRVGHIRSREGPSRQATRMLLITSFFWIFFMTSRPPTTLPKTVCTPFRCRQLASLSTMKN
jgi:hypothetical protein